MKTKIIQFVPVSLSLIIVVFSQFSLWCTGIGRWCYRTFLDNVFLGVVNPLYFFALFILPATIVLLFVSRTVFNSWLKFAAWALPLALIYIATTPVNFTGLGMDFFPFYRDDAARLAGGVFTGVSLIFIIWKSIAARRSV